MRSLTFWLLATLSITLTAQEDIEQYLINDSLEIESLVARDVLLDMEVGGPSVTVYTNFGLLGKQLNKLSDLNSALLANGYGEIPETSLGWVFGNRVDIGEHFSFGTTIFSNLLFNSPNKGFSHSSDFTYLTFLMELIYRKEFRKISLAPGIGMGFSQSILSLKPNDRDEMEWTDLFLNNGLMVAVRQVDFAISTDINLGTFRPKKDGGKHLLNLKAGMVFHPFSVLKPGVFNGETTSVKLNGAPSLSSSGVHFILTWG